MNDNKKISKTIKVKPTINNKKASFDTELLNNILGKSAKKIDVDSFNFTAAILNFCYFIYKKLYISAFLLIMLIISLRLLISDNLIFFSIYIVICIMCGSFFNKYYINIIKRKIKNKTYEK